jgi:hypothetical protein
LARHFADVYAQETGTTPLNQPRWHYRRNHLGW